ncbi:MAG: D-aminoacylase [Chloroflexi bacterium]|nr:D-aminoacylase [Chloroflexota bacterium]
MDVLFRGALVYDGSGTPGVQQDVLVRGERIAAVGAEAVGAGSENVIDAGGLALAPGFIDMHSHADHTLPFFPQAPNNVSQGVTTELVGLCGFSPAPLSPVAERAGQLRELGRGIGPHLDFAWSDFGSFLDRLDHTATNVAALVGHGALRIAAMGMEDRAPTASEMTTMRALLAESLNAGAFGMSTGLVYAPGAYAETDELVELGQELRNADAMYVSHIRNEAEQLFEAVDEAIRIGEENGIRAQVSHLKATGKANLGKVTGAVEHIQAARGRGVRAHADVYPYTAGSTFLHQILPPWVKEGGMQAMVARLQVPEQRQRVRYDVEHGLPGWGNHLDSAGGWHNVLITSVATPERHQAEGQRVSDLATAANADPMDYTLDLLVADRGATVMVIFTMDESDVRTALQCPVSAIGSDLLDVTSPTARVHPRAYGTFARVLGWGVRDAHLFPLEEAVRKMTGLPASILGFKDRGRIAAGMMADIVLFDPTRIADASTYAEPTRLAQGVEYVLLGGELALERGSLVRLDAGRVLRRTLAA